MTIYVVQGSTGEYSDHCEWPVKAFVSEHHARDFVQRVSDRYREIQAALNLRGERYGVPYGLRENPTFINELDPEMQIDYTGTNYNYFPIELDEVTDAR